MLGRSQDNPHLVVPEVVRYASGMVSGITTEATVAVTLNGQQRQLAPGTTLSALVAELGMAPDRVAVERNGEVVPRRSYGEIALAEGDRIEVVTFVGGG